MTHRVTPKIMRISSANLPRPQHVAEFIRMMVASTTLLSQIPEVTPDSCLSFGLHLGRRGYSELDMLLHGNDDRQSPQGNDRRQFASHCRTNSLHSFALSPLGSAPNRRGFLCLDRFLQRNATRRNATRTIIAIRRQLQDEPFFQTPRVAAWQLQSTSSSLVNAIVSFRCPADSRK